MYLLIVIVDDQTEVFNLSVAAATKPNNTAARTAYITQIANKDDGEREGEKKCGVLPMSRLFRQ